MDNLLGRQIDRQNRWIIYKEDKQTDDIEGYCNRKIDRQIKSKDNILECQIDG